MGRLFGTDGIRGVANVDLKPTLAFALGRATAHRLVGPGAVDRRRPGHAPLGRHVRGGDRRRRDQPRRRRPSASGSCPTPALAFLAGAAAEFAAGIMVSASHNPAEDNGLKVLDARGLKLDDDGRGRARAADLARRGARRRAQRAARARSIDAGALARATTATHRLALARIAADRACGSSSTAPTARAASSAPRSSAATGADGRGASTTSPTA